MADKKRILICGASGFIGRNLFEHFSSLENYETYGTWFKNIETNNPRLFQVDLRNWSRALEVTRDMDIVINAAALTDGVGVFSNPEKMEEFSRENTKINTNLSTAARFNQAKNFIFLSCTVMYPSSSKPLKEDEHSLKRVHPKYVAAAGMKLVAEDLCRSYASLGNTKYTVVRHTNIYGPHDKFDLERGHVLAATVQKIMTSNGKIVVWGSGEESRDFLYISDLIRFIETAIQNQENNFEVFNVGYGGTTTINELVEKIVTCSDKNLEIAHDLEKPTIETNMSIDVSKAERVLGWQAKVGLNKGLARTLGWYKKNLGQLTS